MAAQILVVDDDPHIRDVLCFALTNAGLKVFPAAGGERALEVLNQEKIDLIVLDIGLPDIDGLEVCRRVRKTSDVGILFLSARSEEIDRILGIELGGDDYMVKPFSPRELVARVGAILRRARNVNAPPEPPEEPSDIVSHGPLSIDPNRFRVMFGEREIVLTGLELTILKALAAKPGVVFDRNRIVAAAYPNNIHVSDRTIDSHIRNIRGKFAAAGCAEIIETVHGVGFRLRELTGAQA